MMGDGFDSRRLPLLALVTFTAPGAAVLPWDRARCWFRHDDSVRCSGKIGCRVLEAAADAWHASMPKRWSYFRQYCRRFLPGCEIDYVRTVEPQERGVLHVHVVVRVTGVCSVRRLRACMKAYAHWHGFGPQVDVSPVNGHDLRSIARSAGYVAKYVTKAHDCELTVPAIAVSDSAGCVKSGRRRRVRPWSASRTWGDSMRETKERRREYMRHEAEQRATQAAPALPAVGLEPQAAQPPLTCKRISPQAHRGFDTVHPSG